MPVWGITDPSHIICVVQPLNLCLFAAAASICNESSNPAVEPPVAVTTDLNEEGNHLSASSAGNQGAEVEGKDDRVRPDPSAEPVTEFSSGVEAKEEEIGRTSVCARGGGGASELHQYDGTLEEGDVQNGLDCFLKLKAPAVSVMDRLTEIHGSETLIFSSALAAQVVARSHSLVNMEEQTFGDAEEDEEEMDELED